MKLATIVMLGIPLLGSLVPLNAADAASPSPTAISLVGGAVWTSASTGICFASVELLGSFTPASLFAAPLFGAPVIDKEHAYLIWVSDFSVQPLPSLPPFVTPPAHPDKDWPPPYALGLVATGTATIYFNPNPANRVFTDLTDRSTWGDPVATFTRNASLIRSPDNWASDNMIFSADLLSSQDFHWNGKTFNFKNLIPNGMTCYENGQQGSSWEVSTCFPRAAGQ